VNLDAIRQRVWKTLPAFALGFLLGCFVCVSTSTYADKGTDIDIKNLQVDVGRLQEQIKDIDRKQQGVLDWIMAHDRQAINEDLRGNQRVLETEHENLQWEFRSCLGGLGALFLWMLYRQLGPKK
jgi:hypothetical protein